MGSIFGENIHISIFGQSHAKAIGVNIDGLPAGKCIDVQALGAFLARRAPGRQAYATARKEADVPEILCGVVDGKTCGAPLAAIIRNGDVRSEDYQNLKHVPRPAHADYCAQMKFGGAQDTAGGGHFSGRLTAPLCIAGGICLQLLGHEGIQIGAHIAAIAGIEDMRWDAAHLDAQQLQDIRQKAFPVLQDAKGEAMKQAIMEAKRDEDSVGGVIECAIMGAPAGLGDPMFFGMENRLAAVVFGIPAIKGIEFGSGFASAQRKGSENNDAFEVVDGRIRTKTNHHGGILGGITSGMPIIFRVAVKPTPSIGKRQESVDLQERVATHVTTQGRHDPCIVPRAVPCVEAAAAIAVYDAFLSAKKEK